MREKNYETSIADSCKLLRRLSGLSVTAYAKQIHVSHTYWQELEAGSKKNPSLSVKENISKISGLSIESINYLLQEEHPGSEEIYSFIISTLEDYLTALMPKNCDF